MAVTIKKKALTVTTLVTRLFEAEEQAGADFLKKAQELEHTGHLLEVTPTKFGITTPEANLLFQVPLKSETVTLCIKGKLGHTVKTTIKAKVKDLINGAYQKYLDHGLVASVTKDAPAKPKMIDCYDEVMQEYHAKGSGNKVAAIKKLRELMGNSLKEAKDQVEAWIAVEESVAGELPITGEGHTETHDFTNVMEDMKMTQKTVYNTELDLKRAPVPLKDATKLNQPVTGTSGGSIYHVIAIGQDCIVAARIKSNNEIALRAEVVGTGEGAQKAKSGLKFAGLDAKPNGHFSLHLEPEDFAMVKRSIGSTLMAMSIPFWGLNTDLHTLQGVGK